MWEVVLWSNTFWWTLACFHLVGIWYSLLLYSFKENYYQTNYPQFRVCFVCFFCIQPRHPLVDAHRNTMRTKYSYRPKSYVEMRFKTRESVPITRAWSCPIFMCCKPLVSNLQSPDSKSHPCCPTRVRLGVWRFETSKPHGYPLNCMVLYFFPEQISPKTSEMLFNNLFESTNSKVEACVYNYTL